MSTPRAKSIVDVVRRRASRDADRPAYTYLAKGTAARTLTYAALDGRARAIAAILARRLERQQRALMMYSSGLEFIEAFWACLYAGIVPVPVYPPHANGHGQTRLTAIAGDCAPGVVLATGAHLQELGGRLRGLVGDVPAVATDAIPDDAARGWHSSPIGATDVALLQYSSGSTASPKGVVVSHRNILANQAMVKKAFRHSRATTFAGWLPFFHDMGLFGGIVQPMFVGAHSVLMPPSAFLQEPLRWLKAISDFRAHTSGGPNFAYEYCVRRITDDEKDALDLSCWKRAFNGAEKPRAETMRRFSDAFARCGFREEQFYPCYGLAEATLFVSGRDTKNHPEIARAVSEYTVPAPKRPDEQRAPLTNVSSGRSWLQQRVAIVDPEQCTPCDEAGTGEVWIKGPHVATGYWGRPALSEATFRAFLADGSDGPFLRTGDLGFLRDGELFVVGRLKDLIIIRGQNFHPEDIEAAVEQSNRGVEPGGCAAFAVEPREQREAGERLVILIEAARALIREERLQDLCDGAAAAVARTFGIGPSELVVVPRGTIPKTSSGKIQRYRCREAYLAGRFDPVTTVRYDVDVEAAGSAGATTPVVLARAIAESDGGARRAAIRDALCDRLRILLAPAARSAVAPEASPVRIGLDSVRAVQLKHWIESATSASVSIAEILEARSIQELAELIDRQAAAPSAAGRGGPVAGEEASEGQLSHGQRALFFEHEKGSGAAYNISVAIRLMGAADSARIARAVSALLERHPHLAATFLREGADVRQRIRSPQRSPVECIDASRWSEAKLRQEVNRRANRPFDLDESAIRFVWFDSNGAASVLLVVVHHILIDLFSLEALLRDLASLYSNGDASEPSAPGTTYQQFTEWEAGFLASARGDDSLEFWRQTLGAGPRSARLPFCSTRSDRARRSGRAHAFELGDDLAAAVRHCAAREQVTTSVVLLSAFAVLLTQYARERDVIVGASAAGRPGDRFADVLGYFANILPLPLTIDAAEPFSRTLDRVQRLVGRALDHQHYPYPLLTERLGPATAPDGMPLVRYAFTYAQARQPDSMLALLQEDPGVRIPFGSLIATGFPVEREMAPFDITLMVLEWRERLHGSFTYADDRVEAAAIPAFADAFLTLLSALVRQPAEPILRLAFEPHRSIASTSDGRRTAGSSVLQRFERHASANPDARALVYQEEHVTYGELNRRAEKLARYLRHAGIGAEAAAAVHCPRGVPMIVGILGILKAGGAYVPIDVAHPVERLRFVIEDAKVALVLTLSQFASRCEAAGGRPVLLDTGWPDIEAAAAAAAPVAPDPASVAYVIYTSGSTGRPKGVAVTHANMSRLFDSAQERVTFGANDVWTLVHSISFDFSVWEMWGALAHGGTLVVLDHDSIRDPAGTHARLVEQQVTLLNVTPSALYNLLPVVRERAGGERAPALRHVVCGGEALNVSLLAAWFEAGWSGGAKLVNMYGITETTVHTTAVGVQPRQRLDDSSSDIGQPLADVELYVVNAAHHRLPAYALGEIAVGGAGLARGYLFQPALTAARFIPNPFSATAGARLYLTGDLAYDQGHGHGFRYIGRVDGQVKVRGHRIELSEVEANLHSCDDVEWTTVRAAVAPDGSAVLTAYVVCRDGLTVTGLREHLGRLVPDYMVPGRFLRVNAVPITENGKVDLARLDAEATPLPSGDAYAPPRTDAERIIAAIWADVLGVDRVGIDDNYFALGGDSIRSIQIIARARRAGVSVELPRLLIGQTVRQLACDQPLEARERQTHRCEPFELVGADDRHRLPAHLEDAFPANRLLQGLIFHSEFSDDYQVYVTSMHVGLRYVPESLEQAIRATIERHPFLRSSIDTGSYSEPLQLVHAAVDVAVVSRDIRDRPPADQERYLRTWMEAEKVRKFDWRRAPLVRFAVHWRSPDSFQLTLSDPYLDGWCVALLYRELLLGYRALLRHESLPSRAPTDVGQRHFVALEQRAVKDDRSRDFWTRYLEDCPESRLAAGYREGPASAPHGRESVTIPGALLTRIDEVARSASVPLRSVLMAAHGLVLSCLLGQREVVFGVIHNGRPEEGDADQAIGSFLNTVPFRVAVDPGESWVAYVRRLFAAESGIVPHRRFPFAEIKALHGHRLAFDTVFNFTHFHVLESRGGDDLCIREMYASEQTYFPLTVHFNRATVSGALECLLDYDCRRLSPAQVGNLAGAYLTALGTLAGATGEAGAVGRASAQVEERLFPRPKAVDWAVEPQPDSALDLFDRIAAARPDAVALVADDTCLTYRQLRLSAEALARRLQRELDPGRDQLVGLHATHSCHAVIGILGIQKAGAAYVPVDEDCPAERMKFIVADCGMKGVVAENPLASRFEPFRIPVLHVEDGVGARDDARAAVREPYGADPAALAYVIYTSGTTGVPKGVGVSHRAVANLARSARREYGIVQDDRILQFCTLEFDISVEEIVMALCSGATLVLRPRDLLSSYGAFHAYCAREAITCLNVPTAFWHDWVHELVTTGRPFDLPIRLVIIAGEQMRPDLAWQWTNVVPRRVSLVNTYGPTETTVKATKYPVHMTERPSAGSLSQSSPIGSGFGNTTISVLDARLRPVASGVCGELHIGGPAVARGYLNRPGLTAERFIPDPWSAVPGSRCYRTGDIAFVGADDDVHFVGRLDRQVKITGYRVEPEELEAALMDCGGVRQAAVTVERSERGAALLHAFVRMEQDAAEDLESTGRRLREELAARLPRYMMPSVLHFMDRLPMTLSGKVDRTRLLALSRGGVRPGEPGEAGNRIVRDTIAAVYADTVGARHVRPEADFFTLGGDSLKAMRAASRLRNELRCAVSVRDIFENPRIEALAHVLEPRAQVAIEAEAGSPAAPEEHVLSFSQERLWMADQLSSTAAAYTIPAAILIRGGFNRCAFEQSVEEVRRRHGVLRTRVVMRDGRLVPHLSDTGDTAVTHVCMSAAGPAPREGDLVRRLGSDFARARFDLERDAPIRIALCSLGADEHLLLIAVHHIAADGWSIGLLIDELLTLYGGYTRGRPPSLAEPPAQYVDYARRQRAKVHGTYEQQLREYWLRALADMPGELALPLDYVRPAVNEFRGERHCFTLPRDVADAAVALGRSEGVTPFVIMLTAYVTLLHVRSGQTDIVVGTPVSTRDWPDTEGLIGLFVNQLVIRANLAGNPTCRQLVRRVRAAVLSAYDHRDLPFEDVVQMLRPRRGGSSHPLVQTVFAYRDRPWQDVSIEGLALEYPEIHNGAAKYDLEVQVIERRDGDWQGYFEYNTDLFSAATIEKLAADYCRTLRAVVDQRDRPIASLGDPPCEATLVVTAQAPFIL